MWRLIHFIIALHLKFLSTPILIQKFNIDRVFKRLVLKFSLALKMITSLEILNFISIRSIFGGKSSYSNFSLITESIADVINKAFNSNYLQALHSPSNYLWYHDTPSILPSSLPFARANELLFNILIMNNKFIDLYVDDFISICLDIVVNGIYEVTTCFNVITNTFDIIFSSIISNILNDVKQKAVLSLCKLQSEGTPTNVKRP